MQSSPIYNSHQKNFISPKILYNDNKNLYQKLQDNNNFELDSNLDQDSDFIPEKTYFKQQLNVLNRQNQVNRGTRKNNVITSQFNQQIYGDQLIPKVYNAKSNFIGDSNSNNSNSNNSNSNNSNSNNSNSNSNNSNSNSNDSNTVISASTISNPLNFGAENNNTYTGKIQYNSYIDYLEHHGVKNLQDKTKYITNYINIDSSNRITTPQIQTNDPILLPNNAFYFSTTTINDKVQYLLNINNPQNTFKVGDRITLTGLVNNNIILRTVYQDNNNNNIFNVQFTNNSNYVKILCSPNMSFGPYFPLNLTNSNIVNNYNLENTYVNISGFIGYPTNGSIGNVQLNLLNGLNKIYLQSYDNEVNDLTYFYIYLPIPFNGIINTIGYNITLNFMHIGGVPLNTINAEFPLTNDYISGYQTIYSTKNDTISILLNQQGLYGSTFGNNDIYIALLTNVITGYQNPNSYVVDLNQTYYNVVMVNLISSIFQRSENTFRTTKNFTNTKIYWQNKNDGDTIYSASIDDGNYSSDDLAIEIQNKINKVVRIGIDSDSSYLPINNMSVSINKNTNVVSFSSFQIANLIMPIINVVAITPFIGSYTITIKHPNHNLLVGNTVRFTGMISYLNIPEYVLNQVHTITEILDANIYNFIITNVNLNISTSVSPNPNPIPYATTNASASSSSSSSSSASVSDNVSVNGSVNVNLIPVAKGSPTSGGGYNVTAYVNNDFCLLFNYPDTMGNELGFRNVGNNSSITYFNSIITNKSTYINELQTDTVGNPIVITNNPINLDGEKYILMTCLEVNNLVNYGSNTLPKINNVFAKINLKKQPEKILFDTFVSTPVYFYNPTNLDKLTINFYSPTTNNLYEFNNVDHSYVLQIVTLQETLQETGIFSKTGREY